MVFLLFEWIYPSMTPKSFWTGFSAFGLGDDQFVEGVDIGFGAGDDDVGIRAVTAKDARITASPFAHPFC